jgi:hypothetical protein
LGDGAEGDEEERQEDSAEPGKAADIVRRRHGSRDRGAGSLEAQRAARGTSGRGARVRGGGVSPWRGRRFLAGASGGRPCGRGLRFSTC